jgi:ferric-dicitrate binding protein FerR (iron transport regulator)
MHENAADSPRPWWKRDVKGIPVLLFIAVAVLVIVVVILSQVTKSDDDTTTPTGVEACAALADPANVNLEPSDWRRIGDWTQSEMETYVLANCPEQISKVRD